MYEETEHITMNPQPPVKKKRTRKQSTKSKIKTAFKKIERINQLTGELTQIFTGVQAEYEKFEDFKKKMQDLS